MKKIFALFFAVVLACVMFSACGKQEEHDCDYTVSQTYEVKDGELYLVGVCEHGKTNQGTRVPNSRVATPQTAEQVMGAAKSGEFVYFTAGEYGRINFGQGSASETQVSALPTYLRTLKNVTFYAEDGVMVDRITFAVGICNKNANGIFGNVTDPVTGEIVSAYYSYVDFDGVKFVNFTFNGVEEFDGVYAEGLDLSTYGTLKGLTFEKCKFIGNRSQIRFRFSDGDCGAVENVVVDDCTFQNINHELTSAIIIERAHGLTVTDSTFDAVGYNALQMGKSLTGTIVVTGNVFKRIGSRVIHWGAGLTDATAVTVTLENNKFYLNDGASQSTGNYIHSGAPIEIGKNYWEELPDTSTNRWLNNVIIDLYEQEII